MKKRPINNSLASIQPTTNHGNEVYTRLHGYRLILAWSACLVVVIPATIVFVEGFFIYITEIQQVCTARICSPGQLTPESVKTLAAYGLSSSTYANFNIALVVIYSIICLIFCAIFLRYKYNDWMGLLSALLCALSFTCNLTIGRFLIFHTDTIVYWFRFFSLIEIILMAFFYALFPNGRFIPSGIRWALLLFSSLLIATYLLYIFLHITPFIIVSAILILWYCCMGCVIASQYYRYKYVSGTIERQQTRWVVFGVAIILSGELGIYLLSLFFPSSPLNLVGSLLEVVILFFFFCIVGIAMMRYRLWEIDLIINRTLVYGILTGTLVLIYAGSIVLLQRLLSGVTGRNQFALVASTLAIAALFQPLRTYIQKVIDRRFYRRKYDAVRTLAAFGATLHQEMDPNQLSKRLVEVVDETMQPTHISLWLRSPDKHHQERDPL